MCTNLVHINSRFGLLCSLRLHSGKQVCCRDFAYCWLTAAWRGHVSTAVTLKPLYASAVSTLSFPPCIKHQCLPTYLKIKRHFFIFSSSLLKIQYYYYTHLFDLETLRDKSFTPDFLTLDRRLRSYILQVIVLKPGVVSFIVVWIEATQISIGQVGVL